MAPDKWSRWLNEERWSEHRGLLQAALNAVRDRVLHFADLQPGERVIDLGAGTGLLRLEAAQRVGPEGRVVLVDVSDDSLRTAQEQASLGCERFAVADALRLPLASGWADVVVLRSVLIYIADRLAAAREIARVVRPGGGFAAYEPINRRMEHIVDMTGFDDVRDASADAMDRNTLTRLSRDRVGREPLSGPRQGMGARLPLRRARRLQRVRHAARRRHLC